MIYSIRTPLIGLIFVALQHGVYAYDAVEGTEARCWKEWREFRMKEVPKAEDTVSPATGRQLSQSDGAKRTRALKYQAKLDALELRGRDDPIWKAFLEGCAKQ